MEKKKVGGDVCFIYELTTFVPSKPNRPSFLFVEYREVTTTAQGLSRGQRINTIILRENLSPLQVLSVDLLPSVKIADR